jgi:hypothetical protein
MKFNKIEGPQIQALPTHKQQEIRKRAVQTDKFPIK